MSMKILLILMLVTVPFGQDIIDETGEELPLRAAYDRYASSAIEE